MKYESICGIIAVGLPILFHFLVIKNVEMKFIVSIIGGIIILSLIPLIDFVMVIRFIINHKFEILQYAGILFFIGFEIRRRFKSRSDNECEFEEDKELV